MTGFITPPRKFEQMLRDLAEREISKPCTEIEIATALEVLQRVSNSGAIIDLIRRLTFERDILRLKLEEKSK